MTSEKIEVVAPLQVSTRNIHAFVTAQQDWVVSASGKVETKIKNIKKLTPDYYVDGCKFPFQGKQAKLEFHHCSSKNIHVTFNQNDYVIEIASADLNHANTSESIKIALLEWIKQKALKEVERLVELHAKKYNLYPRAIRIKTQKSRWGSCGIRNDINLNWLLMLAPVEVMEYVVVHELCHIRERNHSAKFWLLVEEHLPGYQIHRNWLKKNGSSLMLGL